MNFDESNKLLRKIADFAQMNPADLGLVDKLEEIDRILQKNYPINTTTMTKINSPEEIQAALLTYFQELERDETWMYPMSPNMDLMCRYYVSTTHLLLRIIGAKKVILCPGCLKYFFRTKGRRLTCSDACRQKKSRAKNKGLRRRSK